jgi:hypothetical protein
MLSLVFNPSSARLKSGEVERVGRLQLAYVGLIDTRNLPDRMAAKSFTSRSRSSGQFSLT